ncbi:hypothetical protein FIM04_02990 [SAR202 cluster bacterium AC-409-J13_OGT_754m]|nr:hypothetical protein [SAR202 cluster bacterium AC-409-J13_OGT_754m]
MKVLLVTLTLVLMSVLTGCSKTTQPNQSIQTAPSAVFVPTSAPAPTPKYTVKTTIKPTATLKPASSVTATSPIYSAPMEVVASVSKPNQEFGSGGLTKNLESWADVKLPKFITASHIKIDDIAHVSKFRSSAGHDFSDSFEACCSMKHYFITLDYYGTRFTQPIYSPVDGVVLYLSEPSGEYSDDWKINYEEQTGKKPPVDYRDWNIYIRPDSAPNIWITHMHVNPLDEIVKKVPPTNGQKMMMGLSRPAKEGYRVKAGDLIAHGLGEIIVKRHLDGTGIPSGCNSADSRKKFLQRNLPGCKAKVRLHSIFEFMTDDIFNEYQKTIDVSRSDFIITAEERAKNPLVCEGEYFAKSGNADDPETYVKLQGSSSASSAESSGGSQTDGSSSKAEIKGNLPGLQALASGREVIASFEALGSHVLSKFTADKSYLLVISATGGSIKVLVDDGSGKRGIYSRPLGNGINTYETGKMDPGQIEVSVEADNNINWQIVAVTFEQ